MKTAKIALVTYCIPMLVTALSGGQPGVIIMAWVLGYFIYDEFLRHQ